MLQAATLALFRRRPAAPAPFILYRAFHPTPTPCGRRALKNRDRKERTSLAKAQLYGRIGAAVRAAVRAGGSDPSTNAALQAAMTAAKAAAVPLSIVQRNIDRGAGTAAPTDDVTLGVVTAGGIALLLQASTDNVARLTADVRTVVNKAKTVGARLVTGSGAGAAAGLGFERVAAVVVQGGDGDALMAAAVDAGADDVVEVDGRPGAWRVTGPPAAYAALRDAMSDLPDASVVTADSGLEFRAVDPVTLVDADARAALDALVDALCGVEGVDAVWSSVVDSEGEGEE